MIDVAKSLIIEYLQLSQQKCRGNIIVLYPRRIMSGLPYLRGTRKTRITKGNEYRLKWYLKEVLQYLADKGLAKTDHRGAHTLYIIKREDIQKAIEVLTE